ncbi:MAG: hypothetical protein ACFFA7_14665 [Promethearchaeota archaeon]
MSNVDRTISLNISKFPQNLLISGIENEVKIHAVNTSSKKETYKFDFEGENLKIKVEPEVFNNHLEFNPGETKEITLKLEPTIDGFGKLIININWLKITEYTVKVQKVRNVAPTSKMKSILKSHVFTITEKLEMFDSEEYFIHMDQNAITKAEQQLESLKSEFNSAQSMGSPTSQLLEKIDAYIIQIAKGYLSINNPLKALEYALMLSKSNEQLDLYTNLIRAYASKDFDQMIQLTQNMQDLTLKNKIIKSLALDRVKINPEQAINTTTLIPEPSAKEEFMSNIFSKVIETDAKLALKFINQIDNDFQKVRVLFNIAKELYGQNAQSDVINVFNLIVQIGLISYNKNQDNRKLRKLSYENIKNAINALAEYDSPNTAHAIVENISIQELKEKLTKDLFDIIYEMVDEVQTKVEATPVFSQYFLLNTFVSQVNREITNFSLKGGNLSNNILVDDFNFNIAFLSLFSFDFSIFPILDRVYNDIKYSLNKSIAYFVFPSKENYNQNELNTLKTSLKQFFKNLSNAPGQVLIFNLDFIPYLGKPTIIISSENALGEPFYSKIKKIGEKIELIEDNSLFKGGKISHELAEIFPSNKAKIINLVLSYEFFNDYDIFKTFIQSLL